MDPENLRLDCITNDKPQLFAVQHSAGSTYAPRRGDDLLVSNRFEDYFGYRERPA